MLFRSLLDMSAALRSDVGFFIFDEPCMCSGRGEIVEPMGQWELPDCYIVLLKPAFGVSTPKAYQAWASSKKLQGIDYGHQKLGNYVLVNDLERPVYEIHLFLAAMKNWLLNHPQSRAALMSGSGSTMYAICDSAADAERIVNDAREKLDPALWSWYGKAYTPSTDE